MDRKPGIEENRMIDGLPPVGGSATPADSKRTLAPVGSSFELDLQGISQVPPAEVINRLDSAGRIARNLDEHDISLRFELDEKTQRVTIHALDADGNVLKQLPAGELASLLSDGVETLTR